MSGDPFVLDGELGRVLDDDVVPEMRSGFADRVIAATQGRADPLPQTRQRSARGAGWGRRLALGFVAAGALGTAAAASGLLDDLPIDIPTPREVWSSITGGPVEEATPASAPSVPDADLVPQASQPVIIEGPIDTPEELEEAFRRIDQVRETRRDMRRKAVDRRIDNAIERRRDQGLSVPEPEQVERLKGRIERLRDTADQRIGERLEERREGLRETIDQGGELSREDFIGMQRGVGTDTPVADRIERLRQLPPEERRARIRQWRERRLERLQQAENAEPEPAPALDPSQDVPVPPED